MKAKRILALLTIAALTTGMLVGCGNSTANTESSSTQESTETESEAEESSVEESSVEESESTVEESEAESSSAEEITGGWTFVESPTAEFPEDIQKIFDEAAGQWDGMELKPVALLAEQVVAGTNYCFLAETVVDGTTTYYLPIVYADLDGNVTLTKCDEYNENKGVGEYDEDGTAEEVTGGWTLEEDTYATAPEGSEDVASISIGSMKVKQVIAKLGTQVVSGENSLYLCSTEGGPLVLITMYQDLDGNTEMTNLNTLDVAAYNE